MKKQNIETKKNKKNFVAEKKTSIKQTIKDKDKGKKNKPKKKIRNLWVRRKKKN